MNTYERIKNVLVEELTKNILLYENEVFSEMSKKFFQAASCDKNLEKIGIKCWQK